MRPGKFKKSLLVVTIALALVVAGVTVVSRWPPPVPFDVTPVSVAPTTVLDSVFRFWAGRRHGDSENPGRLEVVRMTLRMHAGKDHPLPVVHEMAEARLNDRWVKIPDATFVNEDDEQESNSVNRLVFFVLPKEASACRVQVTYRFHRSNLKPAVWLWNFWDRHRFKKSGAGSGQRLDIVTRVLDWFIPDPRQALFKTAIVEVNLTNLSVTTTVQKGSKTFSQVYPYE